MDLQQRLALGRLSFGLLTTRLLAGGLLALRVLTCLARHGLALLRLALADRLLARHRSSLASRLFSLLWLALLRLTRASAGLAAAGLHSIGPVSAGLDSVGPGFRAGCLSELLRSPDRRGPCPEGPAAELG